jgi:hypothetical protein
MTNYLLIECIINNLVHDGIIESPAAWKKTVIGTQFYYADFFRAKTGSLISFRISVINGSHVISTTAFINQANFFNISPLKILDECKLQC